MFLTKSGKNHIGFVSILQIHSICTAFIQAIVAGVRRLSDRLFGPPINRHVFSQKSPVILALMPYNPYNPNMYMEEKKKKEEKGEKKKNPGSRPKIQKLG